MNRRQFVVVNNILAPYRLHMFEALNEICDQAGWEFSAHFMAITEPGREHWLSASNQIGFKYKVWADVAPPTRGGAWHFNPGLIAFLQKTAPDVVLFGGPWGSMTGIVTSMIGLPRTPVLIGWLELCRAQEDQFSGWRGTIKRYLTRKYTHFAVPGSMGKGVLQELTGSNSNILTLPNVINEEHFKRTSASAQSRKQTRKKHGLDPNRPLAIWPARLEREKNVPSVLQLLNPATLGTWQIAIVGGGTQRAEIARLIRERDLEEHISIVGPVQYREMPDLYACSDLFLLPSMQDRNPLSVIEAMFSGLPLVLSQQVGNAPEALESGKNGWLCDAENADSIRQVLVAAFGTPLDRLRSMGSVSAQTAENHWATSRKLKPFMDQCFAAATVA